MVTQAAPRAPRKAADGNVKARIPAALKRRLAAACKREDRSESAILRLALTDYLDRSEKGA